MSTYIGFNTINAGKKFRLTDFDLIKQDIYNAIQIRRGEKLMNPTYGSITQDILFDQLDSETISELDINIRAILDAEPRVNATNLIITPFNNGVQISISLTFLETDETDVLQFNFQNPSSSQY